MTYHIRNFAATMIVLALCAALPAQDEKPADAPAPDKAPAKAPAPPKKPAGAKPGVEDGGAAYRPPDPAVETILESKPTTPAGMLDAALTLSSLERPDLAKQFLDQFLAAKPDQAALAEVARRLGGGTLFQLAANKALAPQAQKVVDLILAASAAERHDAARLAAFAKQLTDPSPDVQSEAAVSLRDAGQLAVPFLLAIIADPAQAKAHPLARETLAAIGPSAIPPLVAALTSPDAALQATAIELLGDIPGQQEAVPYLLRPYLSPASPAAVRRAAEVALKKLVGALPTKSDAVALLNREATNYLTRQTPLRGNESDNIAIWQWDAARKQLVAAEFPPQRASAFVAARLGRDLIELAPESVAAKRLYLLGLLESAVYKAGLDNPLPTGPGSDLSEAARFGIDAINDALVQALAARNVAAAKVAVTILGNSGDPKLLTSGGANPAPVVQALRSSDRRLRVAAAEAVMKLKPTVPFAGSSYLTDALADMAAASGQRKAAIAFPTLQTLQELAGMTNSLGLKTVTATNGRELFAAATESPDIELILVSARTSRPSAVELVQQLREDPRTADVPICVLAELDERRYAELSMAPFERVFVANRPPNVDEMKRIVAQAAVLAGDRFVPVKLRQQEGVWAVEALAALASLPPEVVNVRRYEPAIERALFSPASSARAAASLAQFGTPSSQRSLIDMASIGSQPLDVRKAAGAAFRTSVRKFGLRLSPAEILAQYDRYNQSANLDRDTQQLLGALLDVIETKGQGTRGKGQGASAQTR